MSEERQSQRYYKGYKLMERELKRSITVRKQNMLKDFMQSELNLCVPYGYLLADKSIFHSRKRIGTKNLARWLAPQLCAPFLKGLTKHKKKYSHQFLDVVVCFTQLIILINKCLQDFVEDSLSIALFVHCLTSHPSWVWP